MPGNGNVAEAPPFVGANFEGQPQKGARARSSDPWWWDEAAENEYLIDFIGLEGNHLVVQGVYEMFAPFAIRVELTEDVKKHLVFLAEGILERFRR